MIFRLAGLVKTVNTEASKASARKGLRVRFPHPAHMRREHPFTTSSERVFFCPAYLWRPGNLGIMHNPDIRARTIAMCRAGVPDVEIARKLDIPKGTIGYWKFEDRARYPGLYPAVGGECPICLGVDPPVRPYAYLLGQYFGDGHIVSRKRQNHLSVACCDEYPVILDETQQAMIQVLPEAKTGRVQRVGMTEVESYSKHWTCLFPSMAPA
jgi:hypothetical protein